MAIAFLLAKRQKDVKGVIVDTFDMAQTNGKYVCISSLGHCLQVTVCLGDMDIQQSMTVYSRHHDLAKLQQEIFALLFANHYLRARGFVVTNQRSAQLPEELPLPQPKQKPKFRRSITDDHHAIIAPYTPSPDLRITTYSPSDDYTEPDDLEPNNTRAQHQAPVNPKYSTKFADRKFSEEELGKVYPLLLQLECIGTAGAASFQIKNYAWKLNGLLQRKQLPDWWVVNLWRLINFGIVERLDAVNILVHRVRCCGSIGPHQTSQQVIVVKTPNDRKTRPKEVTITMKPTEPKPPAITFATPHQFRTRGELECYQAILEIVKGERPSDDWTSVVVSGLSSKLIELARSQGREKNCYQCALIALRKQGILEDVGREQGRKLTRVHRRNFSPEIAGRHRHKPSVEAPDDEAGPSAPTPTPPPQTTSEAESLLSGLNGHGDQLRALARLLLDAVGASRITFERLDGGSIKIDYTSC